MSRLTRNLVVGLVASVLLNVFFVGLWAGRSLRRRPAGVEQDTFESEIDPSAPMRRVWRNHDAMLRPRSDAVRAARRAVHDALVADPFKPEVMESALAQLRNETGEAQAALHQALVESARGLNLEERRRLAEARGFQRNPHFGRGPR